jgi:hypothetical protein
MFVVVADDTLALEYEPHSAGRIAVKRYPNGDLYGYRLPHGQAPRQGYSRHRRHQCKEGINA